MSEKRLWLAEDRGVNEAAANHERYVAEKFLRLAQVQSRVPYSRSTIYLKVSRGEFPRPIDLGARAVAWLESEVDLWIEQRIQRDRALVVETMAPTSNKSSTVRFAKKGLVA